MNSEEEKKWYITFIRLFSLSSSSLLCFCFILFVIILIMEIIAKKQWTNSKTFKLQLSFGLLLNAISFFFSDTYSETFCQIKAAIYICSLTLLLNLITVHLIMNYLFLSNYNIMKYVITQVIFYLIAWLIAIAFMVVFAIFNMPFVDVIGVCRYHMSDLTPKVSAIYSLVVVLICVITFILIVVKIKSKLKHVKEDEMDFYKKTYNTIVMYFGIGTCSIVVKFILFALSDLEIMFKILDVVFESLFILSVFVLYAIGIDGFKTMMHCMCSKCLDASSIEDNMPDESLVKNSDA